MFHRNITYPVLKEETQVGYALCKYCLLNIFKHIYIYIYPYVYALVCNFSLSFMHIGIQGKQRLSTKDLQQSNDQD